MKHWKPLLVVPVIAALAMVPQGQGAGDPSLTENSHVISISELQYESRQGKKTAISARNVVEIRFFEDVAEGIRLELYYDNGDYSMIDAQAFHLLRNGAVTREVKVVRSEMAQMRFPKGIR